MCRREINLAEDPNFISKLSRERRGEGGGLKPSALTGCFFPNDRWRRDALSLTVQSHVSVPFDAHVGWLDDPTGWNCNVNSMN